MRKITAVSPVNGEAAVCFEQLMLTKRKNYVPIVLIITVACAAYLPTVMPDISASPNSNFTDVGNVQIALNLWGTLHTSGFPLFSLLGAFFVLVVRGVGV